MFFKPVGLLVFVSGVGARVNVGGAGVDVGGAGVDVGGAGVDVLGDVVGVFDGSRQTLEALFKTCDWSVAIVESRHDNGPWQSKSLLHSPSYSKQGQSKEQKSRKFFGLLQR